MQDKISFKEADYINRKVMTMDEQEGIVCGQQVDAHGQTIIKVKLADQREVEDIPAKFCFI